MKLFLASILFIFSINLFANTLNFKLNGKTVMSFPHDKIIQGKLNKINSTEMTLYNAWRGYTRTYIGYDFFKVLDSVFGNYWRNSKTIKFMAIDGYVSISNIQAMIKASSGKTGLLSFKEKNKNGFTFVTKGSKEINPGPYYLVWTNFNDSDKATYGDVLKWPYQLMEIDILN